MTCGIWRSGVNVVYASCKVAPVHPELLLPNCDCGKPAWVYQSRHPYTAAGLSILLEINV